ncbi:MAG: hypothetical protein M1347_03890 [Chloroflexi bacterium]|nr:hypothetical protein [Chloroflexota bacterium]
MDDQEFEAINKKLDTLIRLMAYQIVQGKTLSQGAPILKRLGFTNTDIAIIFDTSYKTVSVRLAESKKKSTSR